MSGENHHGNGVIKHTKQASEISTLIVELGALFSDHPIHDTPSLNLLNELKEQSRIILLCYSDEADACKVVKKLTGIQESMQFSELIHVKSAEEREAEEKEKEKRRERGETIPVVIRPRKSVIKLPEKKNKIKRKKPGVMHENKGINPDDYKMVRPYYPLPVKIIKENAEKIIGSSAEHMLFISRLTSFNETMEECGFRVCEAHIPLKDALVDNELQTEDAKKSRESFADVKKTIGQYFTLKS